MPVRALPAQVSTAELSEHGESWSLPVGVGGDTGEVVSLRLTERRTALVAGPPGSGKTTLLSAVAHAAARRGHRVVLLTGWGGESGRALPSVVHVRTSDELLQATRETEATLILVDDVELMRDTELDEVLVDLMSQGRHRVVLAGNADGLLNSYSGCVARAKRSGTGLLLAARPADVELFNLPRSTVGTDENAPLGRALLVQSGTVTETQIAYHIVDNSRAVEIQPDWLGNPRA